MWNYWTSVIFKKKKKLKCPWVFWDYGGIKLQELDKVRAGEAPIDCANAAGSKVGKSDALQEILAFSLSICFSFWKALYNFSVMHIYISSHFLFSFSYWFCPNSLGDSDKKKLLILSLQFVSLFCLTVLIGWISILYESVFAGKCLFYRCNSEVLFECN